MGEATRGIQFRDGDYHSPVHRDTRRRRMIDADSPRIGLAPVSARLMSIDLFISGESDAVAELEPGRSTRHPLLSMNAGMPR
jgi:hypothetical protein